MSQITFAILVAGQQELGQAFAAMQAAIENVRVLNGRQETQLVAFQQQEAAAAQAVIEAVANTGQVPTGDANTGQVDPNAGQQIVQGEGQVQQTDAVAAGQIDPNAGQVQQAVDPSASAAGQPISSTELLSGGQDTLSPAVDGLNLPDMPAPAGGFTPDEMTELIDLTQRFMFPNANPDQIVASYVGNAKEKNEWAGPPESTDLSHASESYLRTRLTQVRQKRDQASQ